MHLNQLNSSFIFILLNPFNQEAWADFDLSCIYLNKEGFKFKQRKNKFNCSYKTIIFTTKQQHHYIDIELQKAVDLQFFEWCVLLLDYRKNVLSRSWKVKRKVKVYQTDYFMEKDDVIYFSLSGHPLLDMKIMRILNRRVKIET